MADQSDVETALATLVSAALYPNGSDRPSAPGPVCRIYRGWPNPSALDGDLRAGRIHVSIFPGEASARLGPAYPGEWQSVATVSTLAATVNGVVISFDGSAAAGQVAGVLADGKSYAYRVLDGDSASLVAANLAEAIRADRIVNLSLATLKIPGAGDLLARVVCDQSAVRELRRQTQGFRITCWCPDPISRDATAAVIDTSLADTSFLQLADRSKARLLFAGGTVTDQSEDAALFRRDLLYSVEYATTVSATQPEMLFGTFAVSGHSLTA